MDSKVGTFSPQLRGAILACASSGMSYKEKRPSSLVAASSGQMPICLPST